jgi:DNA (cytosine-5)-methyltransferase 1
MNHIELFAGCGGLCLGLQSEKFELLFANELSPMAGETFAYNLLHENLAENKNEGLSLSLHTKWLSSKYKLTQLASRLRENPKEYPSFSKGYSDIKKAEDFKGSLIIGSVVQLNKWLSSRQTELNKIKSAFGSGGVDLVSGGPPCQSFSMAGMREYSNARNTLPSEFAKFVSMVRPKFALLENVTGILHPFEVNKKKVYAWFEVAKAFAAVGYVPLCLHVNARHVGVAQNRTRFLMVLFRRDIFKSIQKNLNADEKKILQKSGEIYSKISSKDRVAHTDLPVFDVSKAEDIELYRNSFLKHLVEFEHIEYSVKDAIDDLRLNGDAPSKYVENINNYLGTCLQDLGTGAAQILENHELRKHSNLVQGRFRIYQIAQQLQNQSSSIVDKVAAKELLAILKGSGEFLSADSAIELMRFTYFVNEEKFAEIFSDQDIFQKFLNQFKTKKQTQRALDAICPAPAALAIPDDACHYHRTELRTLSVREMARIQSFPDNFTFRSKVTTGGQQRKFEVPQYTQVGNAVPPMLGRAIGKMFNELSSKIVESSSIVSPKRATISLKNNSGVKSQVVELC